LCKYRQPGPKNHAIPFGNSGNSVAMDEDDDEEEESGGSAVK
jgi:hypothetical protein